MYALPGQTVDSWAEELAEAMQFNPTHLSLYQLTIEKGTPFYQLHKQGAFSLPDEEVATNLFTYTRAYMAAKGLSAYEISNFAAPGQECRHNLTYWQYKDYVGIGPGAHSRANATALMCWHNPEKWLSTVATANHGMQSIQPLAANERVTEAVLMGLRLTAGINLDDFSFDLRKALQHHPKIAGLLQAGLLAWSPTHLRLSEAGMLVANLVINEVVFAIDQHLHHQDAGSL